MNMKKRNTTKKESTTTTTQNTNEAVQDAYFNFINEAEQSSHSSKSQFPELIEQQDFMDSTIRVFGTPEEPLFLARDVAEWIDYSKNKDGWRRTDKMLQSVDDEEKIKLKTPLTMCGVSLQPNTEYWLLTENGLYEVLMLSRKPNAKKFKSKVKEILKTIRKTGGYVADENMFINTYLPFADESTQLLFRTTLHTIQEQNTLIRTQQETITQQKADLEYKQEMIQKFADQISVADMRQILNRVMRHNGGNFKNRWSLLYREFENKYKMNISLRLYNYNRNHTKKLKSKLDYIDFELHMIPELYELAVKLFESDVKELIEEMYAARR